MIVQTFKNADINVEILSVAFLTLVALTYYDFIPKIEKITYLHIYIYIYIYIYDI